MFANLIIKITPVFSFLIFGVLKIDIDIRAKKKNQVLKTDVRTDIIPHLQAMKAEAIEMSTHNKTELVALTDDLEDIDAKIQELLEEQVLDTYDMQYS